jgi:hypothetical protein
MSLSIPLDFKLHQCPSPERERSKPLILLGYEIVTQPMIVGV